MVQEENISSFVLGIQRQIRYVKYYGLFVPGYREETSRRFCKGVVLAFFVPSFRLLGTVVPFLVASFRFLVPSFRFFVPSFRFWGSREHPPKPPFWKPPCCEPPHRFLLPEGPPNENPSKSAFRFSFCSFSSLLPMHDAAVRPSATVAKKNVFSIWTISWWLSFCGRALSERALRLSPLLLNVTTIAAKMITYSHFWFGQELRNKLQVTLRIFFIRAPSQINKKYIAQIYSGGLN